MAAKKKQHVVTIEELKLKIKHEKASYWQHSTPLFGLAKKDDQVQFLPVEKETEEKVVMAFILDPTDFISERVLELAELFQSRYHGLPWISTVIFDLKLMFTKNPQFWDHFKKHPAFASAPIYMDNYSEFWEWAKCGNRPKVLIYNRGVFFKEYVLDQNSLHTFLQLESDLQNLLREKDRGLPLPLLYEYELDSPIDLIKPESAELSFKGHWIKEGESAVTDDHNAVLSIPFEGRKFRLIASLHTQARESASRVTVTFNDKPLPQSFVTPALIADNHGGVTSLEVTRFQGIYDIFSSNEVQKGTLQLHFKDAANSPVIYWSCKIG